MLAVSLPGKQAEVAKLLALLGDGVSDGESDAADKHKGGGGSGDANSSSTSRHDHYYLGGESGSDSGSGRNSMGSASMRHQHRFPQNMSGAGMDMGVAGGMNASGVSWAATSIGDLALADRGALVRKGIVWGWSDEHDCLIFFAVFVIAQLRTESYPPYPSRCRFVLSTTTTPVSLYSVVFVLKDWVASRMGNLHARVIGMNSLKQRNQVGLA